MNIIRTLRYKVTKKLLYILNTLFKNLVSKREAPLIFIVGAPRSGTTLVYQYLTSNLNLSYLCNFANNHYHSPLSATYIMSRGIRKYTSNYSSKYGVSTGRAAPSQGDNIWKNLLINCFNGTYTVEHEIIKYRHMIYMIANIIKKPFICKSIHLSTKINLLSYIFPKAIYIVLERDIIDNAYSQIINYRSNGTTHGRNGNKWVSAQPSNYEDLESLPEIEKNVRQLISLRKDMEKQLMKINPKMVMRINYDFFCNSPKQCISEIIKFSITNGFNIEYKKDMVSPEKFNVSSHKEDNLPDIIAIKKVLSTI